MAFFFPFCPVLDKKLNVLYCKRLGNKGQPCPSVFATVRMATASDIRFFLVFESKR